MPIHRPRIASKPRPSHHKNTAPRRDPKPAEITKPRGSSRRPPPPKKPAKEQYYYYDDEYSDLDNDILDSDYYYYYEYLE